MVTQITVGDGKYTIVHEAGARLHCLRYGEPWRDLNGDGMVLALTHEIEILRSIIDEVHSWIVCAAIASPEDMMQSAERIAKITTPGAP